MTQLERHQDNELAHHDSDEIAVSFHWPAPVLGSGPLPGTRERVQRILDAAPPIALLQRLAHKTVRRVRYELAPFSLTLQG